MRYFIEEIKEGIEDFLKIRGYVLFDIKWITHRSQCTLKIYADRPQGGITLKECSQLNNEVSAFLDKGDFNPGPYTLEVSSPGMDWPLRRTKDYARVKERFIEVLLKDNRILRGFLKGINNESSILLQTGDEDLREIYLKDILKAKEVIDKI